MVAGNAEDIMDRAHRLQRYGEGITKEMAVARVFRNERILDEIAQNAHESPESSPSRSYPDVRIMRLFELHRSDRDIRARFDDGGR